MLALSQTSAGHKRELVRGIGIFGSAFLVLNGMIGAGIFALPSAVAAKAGVLSPWLFLGVGMLIITVVLTAYNLLRSDMQFQAGSRERVLGQWQEDLQDTGPNIRFSAEVKNIRGDKGTFVIELSDGDSIATESVVLAIGLEGNPRKLGVEGQDLPCVQYQLDDPKEYSDERIIVVGAGDAAIENALALAEQNEVGILNRRDEFSRAKEGNLNAVLAAVSNPDQRLHCH